MTAATVMPAIVDHDAHELAPVGTVPPSRNPALTYLASLPSPGSRKTLGHALRAIARHLSAGAIDDLALFPWHQLRVEHCLAVRAWLIGGHYASRTVSKHATAARSVLKHSWMLGHVSADDYLRCVDALKVRVVNDRPPAGRSLSPAELRRLFEVCELDETPAGARDAAVFALGYGLGLRRAEIAGVRLGDYDREKGELTLIGKGRKWACCYVTNNGTSQALAAWLDVRPAGDAGAALFLPVRKDGRIIDAERFSPHAISTIIRRRGRQAGVRLSPHDLRRSMVTDLRRVGVDIELRRRLARHASVVTTSSYDRGSDEEARTAILALSVPFRGRSPSS